MSISIQKLVYLLEKCNMYASKYYTKNGICYFINVISKTDGNEYMLHTPSKYNISLRDVKNNVFEIKTFDMNKSKDIMSDYGNYSQDVDSEMGVNVITENNLLNNYKNEKINTNESVKCLHRHIKRLCYITKSTEYKVIIEHQNVLGVINKNNEIIFYEIKNNSSNTINKLLVCFDMELLYKNIKTIQSDLLNVKNSINTILDKNYNKNINYIHDLLTKTDMRADILNNNIMEKKNEYYNTIKQLEELLMTTNKKEKEYKIQIENGNSSVLHNLRDLLKTKSNILLEMINIINKKDNLTIMCDKLLFDNIILINQLKKNTESFYKLDN